MSFLFCMFLENHRSTICCSDVTHSQARAEGCTLYIRCCPASRMFNGQEIIFPLFLLVSRCCVVPTRRFRCPPPLSCIPPIVVVVMHYMTIDSINRFANHGGCILHKCCITCGVSLYHQSSPPAPGPVPYRVIHHR